MPRTVTLEDNEIEILRRMFDDYSDNLGNAGCNDFEMPNTDQNWALYVAAEKANEDYEEEERPKGKKICGCDFIILEYLKERVCGKDE